MPRPRKREMTNASEAAKSLGVKHSTLIRWANRGCPVVYRPLVVKKRHWVFDIAAVSKWRKQDLEFTNASEVAKILGVDNSTVIGWPNRGCPVVSRQVVGKKTRWQFDIVAVSKWRNQDLARLEKKRADIQNPLLLTSTVMRGEEERRFKYIIERLVNFTGT